MWSRLIRFYKIQLGNFFTALFHLFLFLPYFFSAPNLLKTLASPWKNIKFNSWSSNLISRFVGFSMRSSMLLFYLGVQIFYILLIPFVILFYLIFLPVLFILSLLESTELEKKQTLKNAFIKNHMLKSENQTKVEEWFEIYYKKYLHKSSWWNLNNLFSIPPLARDWAVGYTPGLEQFATDLCSSTYQTTIKDIINREKEMYTIERALLKSEMANVLIIGEAGVGKHTIIDAFAKRIYEGRSNPLLAYKRVLKLNLEKILSQFSDLKTRENFLEGLFQEAQEAKNIILLIENIDKYVSSDKDRVNLTNSIEKFAKSSNLQLIGITNPFFFQKYIYSGGLMRYFEPIHVYEINLYEAERILLNASFSFEKRYCLNIPYETIINTLDKSDNYITHIPFPEKALELLDEACVFVKEKKSSSFVTPDVVDQVLSEKTHVPVNLSSDLKQKLLNLENLLGSRIIGQDNMIKELASSLRRSYLLIGKRKKPLATFLFLGPTGVGKTETAKVISQILFNNSENLNAATMLIRFDMSLYQSKNDISKLVGYLETNEPGLLTEKIRETPYGVLLLDEIEKADKDLINIFLTILDEGYFTDGYGKRVDCKNLIIIATSNAPSLDLFAPEFLNRFDGIVTFNFLDKHAITEISQKMLSSIADDMFKLYNVRFSVSPDFLEKLIQKSYDEKYGARNMERLLRQTIEDKVAKLILEGKATPGQNLLFS